MNENGSSAVELKTLIKLARKKPVAFAFNPGKSDDEHYLRMDRRKSYEILRKVGKVEGPGSKVAAGTAEVDGKTLNLTCENPLPNMAKRLKKFLMSLKIAMKVQILDLSGNVIDADSDDLPDGDAKVDDSGTEETASIDTKALQQRLAHLRSDITTLSPSALKQITKPFEQLVAMFKSGEFKRTELGADKVEALVAKLRAQSTNTTEGAALLGKINTVKTSLAALPKTDAQEKLMAALKATITLFKADEFAKAELSLAQIIKAMAKLGAEKPAPPTAPPPPPERADPQQHTTKPEIQARVTALNPDLRRLKDLDPDQFSTARAQLETFQTLQAAGEFDQAADLMDDIELALAAKLPPSNVGFQKLRLRWIEAKKLVRADIKKLDAALKSAYQDSDGAEAAARLEGVLARFNEGLADGLDKFGNAAPGEERNAFKSDCLGIVKNYLNFLNTSPLVRHIENNPFVKTPLRVALVQPLLLLEAELAKGGA